MLSVDKTSSVTLFEQLHSQVIEQITNGSLIAGTKLAPVRQLAKTLEVAPYTVARLYRALEADGFVETLGRNGTVVKARAGTSAGLLQVAANEYAARAQTLGIDRESALTWVTLALRDLR